LGDLDRLRKARQEMASIFPLSEQLWSEWLSDEETLVSSPEETKQHTLLYKQALKEFMCKFKTIVVDFFRTLPTCFATVPSIWLNYCRFVQRCYLPSDSSMLPSEEQATVIRDCFDDAVGHIGLDLQQGDKIWSLFREFETEILSRMESVENPEDEEM
jgi:hypothetical protein